MSHVWTDSVHLVYILDVLMTLDVKGSASTYCSFGKHV